MVFETRTLIETRDGRRFPAMWGVPGRVVRVFAHATRHPVDGGFQWLRGTAAEVAIDDLRIFTSCMNIVGARSRRGLMLRMQHDRCYWSPQKRSAARRVVGRRAALLTSSAGPTLSERDA